jgi:exosortase K
MTASREQSAVFVRLFYRGMFMEDKKPLSPPSTQSPKSGITGRIPQLYRVIKPDLIFYFSAAVLAFAGKLFYSLALMRGLLFLLAPVTFLVSAFTGIPFAYEETIGYVNQNTGIVIGKSCAGMNYLILLYAMTVISFTHYIKTTTGKLMFQGVAIAVSWLLCVYATATRIIISIPLISAGESFPLLKTDTAHKVVGIVVYVTILLIYYNAAEYIFKRFSKRNGPKF